MDMKQVVAGAQGGEMDHGAKMALADKENESRLERAFKEQQGAQTETLRTIVTMLAERLGAPAPAAGK